MCSSAACVAASPGEVRFDCTRCVLEAVSRARGFQLSFPVSAGDPSN